MRRRGTGLILEAIEPSRQSVDATELRYPHLRAAMGAFGLKIYWRRGSRLLRHPIKQKLPKMQDMSQEISTAYLLTASYRLQKALTPVDKIFWSKQFTWASINLFGRPDNRQVKALALDELRYFEALVKHLDNHHEFTSVLLKAYRALARGQHSASNLDRRFHDVLVAVKIYFQQNYQDALSVFDEYSDDHEFTPAELKQVFEAGLAKLAKTSASWRKWEVVLNNTAGLSVEASERQIAIGRHRVAVEKSHAVGLFAHEVLVHANRAVQGAKLSKKLATGLPDYLEAEEGLGVVSEAALQGAVPVKVKDRYLDIALAMGNYRRRPVTREQLFNICYVRAVLRSLDDGEDLDLDELEKAVWQHVNRIYRGSLGDNYVGVFTKDIAYYQGFVKIASYLTKRLRAGRFEDSLVFSLSGKFDPTSKDQRRLVKGLIKRKKKQGNRQ